MRITLPAGMAIVCFMAIACSPMFSQPTAGTAEVTIAPTRLPTTIPEPTETAEPITDTSENIQPSLRIWWPDSLQPTGNETAALTLADYVDTFHTTTPGVTIELRLKKAQDTGGILETIRTASSVAPDALPDITLLRRSDLLTAVEAGYVMPIEGLVTSAILGDLYPSALDLGRVDDVLYGLAYGLDIEHIAYRPVTLNGNFATFEDVLQDQQKFVFPAGVTQGLSDVLLLQYLSAGGTINELAQGKPNTEALETVLTFYQQAVVNGVIDRSVLDYARSDDYLFQLAQGKFDAGVVFSSQYLSLLSSGQALEAAPIPLAGGAPSTIVNGWIWVIVTEDKDRQALALRFAEWMMDSERLAAYTRMVNMLPARRAAMRSWEGGAFTELASTLLNNAFLPIAEGDNATLRSMENALAAVISGQRTPAEAVSDALGTPN